MHRHYASELSLEYLAEKFFISPYYLSHQFRRVTGFSLINYIQITRVRNAQQLLLYTDMKIAEYHDELRLYEFSQFNRVFNKFCHTSPSQFRVNGIVTPITAIPYEKEPSRGARRCNIFWCRPFPGQAPFYFSCIVSLP
ncbi:MAG: helix-turn-helix domain-containing protein [Gemmiger formicilis]|uniref:helix-turn-helix domain-containing protein n=1 Tax=Gemmiger formicilis TaxID=745368 RepID=UPI00399FB3EE